MSSTVLLSGLLVFAAFAYAVRWHFTATKSDWRFKVLAVASAANMVLFARDVWLRGKEQPRQWVGLALIWLGALLFAWALQASRRGRLKLIFEQDRGGEVLRDGPYRFVRHPFYAAYIMFYGGCAVATLHPLNIAFAAGLAIVLTRAALAEEAGFDASPNAADYAAYRRTAGLFWPKLL